MHVTAHMSVAGGGQAAAAAAAVALLAAPGAKGSSTQVPFAVTFQLAGRGEERVTHCCGALLQ